jgi:hypothetical protein
MKNKFRFTTEIALIGINPFVSVPDDILKENFSQAGKDKGKVPVKGTVNNLPYRQTLVKYSGLWRLYINNSMLKNSPKRIGETIEVTIEFDPGDRTVAIHPKLQQALNENKSAKTIFENLTPSGQLEIIRYISNLKKPESVDRNIRKAIDFLLGKGRFVGRDKP